MGSTADPNVRYDQTSMGLDYNVDDTWANARSTISFEALDDQAFGQMVRHTNKAPEQWRDPSKTTRTWPDPPIAQRAWSFDAHLGVHAGDNFDVGVASVQSGANSEGVIIGQMAAVASANNTPLGQVMALTVNGTTVDVKLTPAVQAGVIIGKSPEEGDAYSYAYNKFGASTYLKPPGPKDQWSGDNFGLRHEIVGSARHIYEPHFLSTPYADGLTFLREGIDTARATYSGFDMMSSSHVGAAYRMIYTNSRAERRDFGVSQTQKVPTGGIGGNPFWLKDTKDWPDILRSLHFDFMPFMVPSAKTRPVNYRFWDSMYSTALFGGPTFAIVLDDYGIFDEEYYRMVISHFTQSEMQIVQWRAQMFAGNKSVIGDTTALSPRNYMNPRAWHQARAAGTVDYAASTHPFKDTKASDFMGGSFSMEGWRGPCAELVLGFPPDIVTLDDKGKVTKSEQRYYVPLKPDADGQVLMRRLYPYYDSIEELTMDNKRKLHQHNCMAAHPFAVQDYYNTFVLAATATATYKSGQDIFAYSDTFDDMRITPAMFSHQVTNSPNDIPFTVGKRFLELMADATTHDAMASLHFCFDDAILEDTLLMKLHGPIVSVGMTHVKGALGKLQLFALNKLRDAIKQNAAIVAEKYLWPMLETLFPNLAPLIKKNLEKLANAIISVDFTKPFASWGTQMGTKANLVANGAAADGYDLLVNGDGLPWIKKSMYQRFKQRPDIVTAGEEAGTEMGEFPMGEGMLFPQSEFDDFLREIGDDDVGPGAERGGPFKDLDTIPEDLADVETAMADVEVAVQTAVEASMAAVCGPLIVMVAITLVLNWWTAKMEQDAKDAAAAADAAAAWKNWDTMRIPFSSSYLSGTLGNRMNKLAGYGSTGDAIADSLSEVRGLYGVGMSSDAYNNLVDETYDQRDIQEGQEKDGDNSTTDPYRVKNAIQNYRDQMRIFMQQTRTPQEITEHERLLSQSLNDYIATKGATGWEGQHGYAGSKGQRYMNMDPTNKQPLAGDLRTVANLIAMNHLSLCVIDPAFFDENAGGKLDTEIHVRARQLLVTAEIIRTMRVVDHFMRAASWKEWSAANWSATTRPDESAWHPYPPMPGPDMVPTSLTPAYMTPIPVLVPTKNDMPSGWYQSLNEMRWEGHANLFEFVESDDQFGVKGSVVWDGYVADIEKAHGACPTYTFTDRSHSIYTVGSPTVTTWVRNRAVPVPIFAPGRSPTLFISSLDPTFAWPTLAMSGGNMSAFIDETKYFDYLDAHKICLQPDDTSADEGVLLPWLTAALKKDPSCFPTLGSETSLLLLQPDPTPYSASHPDEFLVVNRSVSTIVVVSMYNQTYQAEGATLKPGQQTPVDSAPGDGTVLKALFYVTPLEMYADVRDGGLNQTSPS